jgi:hypothetical protein
MSASIDYLGSRDSPDYLYYNATIVNNNTSTTTLVDDPDIIFQDDRKLPLLKDSSNYVLSVENFALNGATKLLPLFIPQIVTPINNVNLTIYTITFTITDAAGNYAQSTQNLIWETEDSSSFVQQPVAGTQTQVESPYYYLYTFQRFVTILNKALALAWTDVKTIVGGTYGTHCPFFTYNEATGTFTLFQDVNSSIVPYGTVLPPPHNVTSAAAGYVAGEFSFVGYDSNLEGLINNLATQYYGANAILTTTGTLSLTAIAQTPTRIPTIGITTSYVPMPSAPPYQLYFDNTTTLVSGTPYLMTAQDAFYIPAGGAQLLQNTATQPIVIPANTLFPLTVQWNVFFGGAIESFNYTSVIVVPQTISMDNDVPFTLPNGSYILQYPAVNVTLNTGTIYFPNNVVQVDLITSLPSQPINTAINGHLYLQQNTGGLVNPFTNTPISITNPVYVGTTEYQSSTDTLWSPVSSVVMTTTYIPVINEFSSNPLILGSANTGFSQDSGNAFARVLIEDAFNTDNLDYYKYQPLTPTMSSLSRSHEPLSTIDFRFKWRNRLTNALIPMKLPNSGTVTVRLLFKKKGVE